MRLKSLIKRMLVHSPIKYSEPLDALLRLTLLKRWIDRQQPHPYFPFRESLYTHISERVLGNVPIVFLEFGVYQGSSMRAWTRINTASKSEFVGFDSFEGLPETWLSGGGAFPTGTFSTGGTPPLLDDPRVRFVKGWFHHTLPCFLREFTTDKQLVVHCDADLYTSTLFVLCSLSDLLRPGTILLFDDFASMLHEFRAFEDYTHSFRREYDVLGAAGRVHYYNHVAVRFTG